MDLGGSVCVELRRRQGSKEKIDKPIYVANVSGEFILF